MKDSNLFAEIIYKFCSLFIDDLSKYDSEIAKVHSIIPQDEILERSALPPIASVFILNECIKYYENNKSYPNESQIKQLVETSYRNYNDYINMFSFDNSKFADQKKTIN